MLLHEVILLFFKLIHHHFYAYNYNIYDVRTDIEFHFKCLLQRHFIVDKKRQ